MSSNIKKEKRRIREEVWKMLEEKEIARFPRPVFNRIPNFVGSKEAAERLTTLRDFQLAGSVKINPDAPQLHIRYQALLQGKLLLMPTPRLRQGFLLIDPSKISRSLLKEASSIRGAFRYGEKLSIRDLPKIDIIVAGSVAVSHNGVRLGKGEGYSEIEYAILRELNLVDDSTPILTSIHEAQIIDKMPREEYDLAVDIVATPKRLFRTEADLPRPQGIIWDRLDEKKLNEIPILKELKHL